MNLRSATLALLFISTPTMAAPPGNAIWLSASMPNRELVVGQEYAVTLHLEIPDGWSSSDAGMPQPILQIDVPPSVHLSGRYLTEFRDLARNEFLEEPYERLIDQGDATVRFTLTKAPTDGQMMAFNVIAYVAGGGQNNAYFIRRRVELPVKRGASDRSDVQATRSTWGVNGSIAIGDTAPSVTLPRADGSLVALSDLIGKQNLIITTYRAHW